MSNVIRLSERRGSDQMPGAVMAQITIFSDGEATVWLGDLMQHKEQFNWLASKIIEATGVILSEKAERTGEL